MKIYNRIVIDMTNFAVIEEESHEYNGPISECSGGGGGDSVDEDYNRRMANIAEAQQGMAEEMFNLYKYGTTEGSGGKEYKIDGEWVSEGEAKKELQGYDPDLSGLETKTVTKRGFRGNNYGEETKYKIDDGWYSKDEAKQKLKEQGKHLKDFKSREIGPKEGTPGSQLGLEQAQIGWETDKIEAMQDVNMPKKSARLMETRVDTQQQGLGLQQDLYKAMGDANLPEQSVGLMSNYMSEAREGVDIDERMGAAQADVVSGYQGVQDKSRLAASRMGIDPSSGRFVEQQQDMNLNMAKDIAGARSQARRKAEQEEFNRLQNATGLGLIGK